MLVDRLEKLEFLFSPNFFNESKNIIQAIEESNLMTPTMKVTVDGIWLYWPNSTLVFKEKNVEYTGKFQTVFDNRHTNLILDFLQVVIRNRKSEPVNIPQGQSPISR